MESNADENRYDNVQAKEGGAVEKIVIVAADSGADPGLLACLGALFPECEIEVVSRQREEVKRVAEFRIAGVNTRV